MVRSAAAKGQTDSKLIKGEAALYFKGWRVGSLSRGSNARLRKSRGWGEPGDLLQAGWG